MQAFFGALAQIPGLPKTLFIKILGLGPPGLAAQRCPHGCLVEFVNGVLRTQVTPSPTAPRRSLRWCVPRSMARAGSADAPRPAHRLSD